MFLGHTYIHCGRELVLEAAMKRGMTDLLWLDTDMTFPRTAALKLAAHNVPVVGCNYRARRQGSGQFTAHRENGERVETTEASTGLEAVGTLGFGCLLLRLDVVPRLHRPWFRHGLNEHGGDVGEDFVFCRALREAGFRIYLDHDLSKDIGHVGTYTYRTIEEQSAVDVAG
jgi:hypothetical protein